MRENDPPPVCEADNRCRYPQILTGLGVAYHFRLNRASPKRVISYHLEMNLGSLRLQKPYLRRYCPGTQREMNKDHQHAAYGSPGGRTTSASSIRDEAPIRKAARLVMDEMGAGAARYAGLRAQVLDRQGDAAGASAWRRVAPVIQELERETEKGKSPREKG
jgi:hypothetical protein